MKIAWPNENLPDPICFSSEGPFWIFDLDGVIIEITQTRYELLKRGLHKQFNRAGVIAEPIKEMILFANKLHDMGHRIVIVTGRDGYFLQDTAEQLSSIGLNYSMLYMREAGSTLPSAVEKRESYEYLKIQFPRLKVFGAIDDNPEIVAMWRGIDVPALLFRSLLTDKGVLV